MTTVLSVLLSAGAGAVLGFAHFAGLRATVERMGRARRPGALALGSLLGRTVLTVGGLFLVARLGGAPGLGGALLGFLVARTVLVARARRALGAGRRGGGS